MANIKVIKHNEIEYSVDLDGDSKAEVISDYGIFKDGNWWVPYKLWGAHEGPAIVIELKNPHYERDDDGTAIVIEGWRWADDKSIFDDDVLMDVYADRVRDDWRNG